MSFLVSKASDISPIGVFNKSLFTLIKEGLKLVDETPEGYKPVHFVCYLRTDKDNLVMTKYNGSYLSLDESALSLFTLCSDVVETYPNLLVDLCLLSSKTLLESAFQTSERSHLERIVTNSTCYPVGAIETEDNYYIVSNIIVSLDVLNELSSPTTTPISRGYYLKPIETLSPEDALEKAIASSLVLVKSNNEVNKNE